MRLLGLSVFVLRLCQLRSRLFFRLIQFFFGQRLNGPYLATPCIALVDLVLVLFHRCAICNCAHFCFHVRLGRNKCWLL